MNNLTKDGERMEEEAQHAADEYVKQTKHLNESEEEIERLKVEEARVSHLIGSLRSCDTNTPSWLAQSG